MNKCTHTWVNKGYGDDYCSKCGITKEQLVLGLEVKQPEEHEEPKDGQEPEELKQVAPKSLADIYKPKGKAK